MKLLHLLICGLLFTNISFSQEIGEQIITDADLKLIFEAPSKIEQHDTSNDKKRLHSLFSGNILFPKDKKLKKGEVYDSIVYVTWESKWVYFKAKIVKRKRNFGSSYDYEPEYLSPINHLHTGKVYVYPKFNENKEILDSEPMYHLNGNIYRQILVDNNDAKKFLRFNKQGNLVFAFTRKTFNNYEIPNTSPIKNERHWSKFGISRNIVSNGKSIYSGYPHLGTLHTAKGYILTGFMFPFSRIHGNASVIFLENENSNTYHWALVVDKKIKELIPAKASEKPDIEKLNEQTFAEATNYEGSKIQHNFRYKNYKGQTYIRSMHSYEPEVVKLKTKDLEQHSGYGIHLDYEDLLFRGDKIALKVGFWKNGKLDGLAYDADLEYYISNQTGNSEKYTATSIKWDVEMGFFDKGIFSYGHTIDTKIPIAVSSDVFSLQPYPNFVWKSYNEEFNRSDETVSIFGIKNGYNIYSTKLNRSLKPISVDVKNKTITVNTDIPGITHTFTAADASTLFSFQPKYEQYNKACPPTVAEDMYEYKNISIANLGGSREVTGSYVKEGRTVYLTRATGEADLHITVERSVKTGTRTVACPICNGKGYVTKSNQKGAYCEIVY